MIGQTISHYKILAKLGEGGMGVVYKAEDLKLKRPVALKFLPPELTRDDEAKKRFMHEAEAASALQHHNICTIHEIDEMPDSQIFIAMDCYDGETLKERIARGPLPVAEAVDIARQIAAGLSKAHGAGMVHRDIKPANIMVTKDGVAKILDFGLAKLAGQTKLTRTGSTLGTVAYMSPEQAKGAKVDTRSDIFSLGAVLYEMLTGEVPFPGEHEAAVLYGIVNSEPEPLAEQGRDIPGSLQGIIDKALNKSPAQRYQSVLELRNDLETVSSELGVEGTGHRRMTARPGGGKGGSRTKIIIAAAAAVVIVAVLASIVLPRLWRPAPDKTKPALAVMDFRDLATPNDPIVSAGITELVNIGLNETDVVRIISSDYLHDLRRRLFGSSRGAIEESQTMEIARKAGATLFLTGTITQSAAGKLVTWHLVDVRSGDQVKGGGGQVEGNELGTLANRLIDVALPLIARACGVMATNPAPPVEGLTTQSHLAYQYFVAGILAAERARPLESIAELKKAVAQDSTFALAYLWLARIYFGPVGFQQEQLARECAEKAWTLRSRLSTRDRLRLESLRYDLGNRKAEAIATLRAMLKRWPDDRDTMAELEQRLFWNMYFADVVNVGEEGRLLHPDDIYLGGAAYIQSLAYLGRIQESFRVAKSYLEQHPQEAISWVQLAEAYRALGQPDSAEAAYRRAEELDPNRPPIDFARCAYHRGDLKGAIKDFERVLENKSLDQDLRKAMVAGNGLNVNLALLYIEAGRFQRARDVCREYFAKPDVVVVRHLLAMDRTREVLDLVRQWTDQDTTRLTYKRATQIRGFAMVATGDFKGAQSAAEILLNSEAEWGGSASFVARQILAEAALAEHNPDAALDALAAMKRQGVPIGGHVDIDYRTDLARAYRMASRLDEAAGVHKEMLRIYGGHALSHYELGQIYEEMKRPADARKEYTKFLEMWSEADEGLPQLVDARKRLAAL